jgi:hypothetical protein
MIRLPGLAPALLAAALVAGMHEGGARAQTFPIGASVDVASGVEGGGKGHATGVRRARTLFRFGGEMALSEEPGPRVAAGVLLEIEPRTSVGADIRYVHLVGERFAFHIGAIGIFAPTTLFGASVGGELRLSLSRRVAVLAGPTVRAFFVGNDLPDGTVIFQGLFNVGIHVSLK